MLLSPSDHRVFGPDDRFFVSYGNDCEKIFDLWLAADLNSNHGWQLSAADKEMTAKSLYAYGCTYEDIADTLSVGKVQISEWLSRIVKDNKEKRNSKIFDLWLACHTQEEIAAETDCAPNTVKTLSDDFCNSVLKNQTAKSHADHATDFDIPAGIAESV